VGARVDQVAVRRELERGAEHLAVDESSLVSICCGVHWWPTRRQYTSGSALTILSSCSMTPATHIPRAVDDQRFLAVANAQVPVWFEGAELSGRKPAAAV
jgi:hypothetical protein